MQATCLSASTHNDMALSRSIRRRGPAHRVATGPRVRGGIRRDVGHIPRM